MSESHEARAKRLFLAALDLPAAERTAYLDAEAGPATDAGLRARVEELLESFAGAGDFLSRSPAHACGPDEESPDPQRIGPYRIIGRLAAGGMGVVYEAEQDHPRRTVALKVLRQGLGSHSAKRRFEQEAAILARLQHPAIAQIYEASMTSDGQGGEGGAPYFAMELVRGALPITRWAEERGLTVRERLELFASVCDAVHHGHESGVVHRDLKPANILVDEAGHPKVIDFGVARATDADLALTTQQTGMGQLLGTVQYMAPEQIEADPDAIDARTDVYALGLVVYELLAGRPPYDVTRLAIPAAARVIREELPTALSSADRVLRGDVETLVHKALEKEPHRRYAGAADLAADVRRFLSDQPIEARPASTGYRLRVFARRNRALVTAVGLVFLALASATVVSTTFAVEAEEARASTEQDSRETEAINAFFMRIFERLSPESLGDDEVSVTRLLDEARRDLESIELERVSARLDFELARIYKVVGNVEVAEELARDSLARWDALGDPRDPRRVATLYELAELLTERDDYTGALALLDEAFSLVDQTESASWLRSDLHVARANLLERTDDRAAAELDLRRALRALQEGPGDPAGREAQIRIRLGALALARGETERGYAEYDRALELLLADDERRMISRAELLEHYGTQLGRDGEFERAGRFLAESLELRRAMFEPGHASIASALVRQGHLMIMAGRHAQAVEPIREAARIHTESFGERSSFTAATRVALGAALGGNGQLEAALVEFTAAIEVYTELVGADSWASANARSSRGRCLVGLGRFAEAERELETAWEALRSSDLGPAYWGPTAESFVELYAAWERPDELARWRELVPADLR